MTIDYIKPLSYSFTLRPYKPVAIKKTEGVRQYLKGLTYSATTLEDYYHCPLFFYYKHVLLPKEKEDIYEDLEGKDVGNIVHQILKEYFNIGYNNYNEQRFESVINGVFKGLFGGHLKGQVLILRHQVKKRLSEFIREYKNITGSNNISILALEKEYTHKFDINGIGEITIKGTIDRLEKRDNDIFIVDYKTSSERRQYEVRWNRFDLNDRVTWKKAFMSIQLLFYMHLLTQCPDNRHKPTNASVMLLREKDIKKTEIRLFKEGENKHNVPHIIETLIREICDNPTFKPTDDLNNCKWCRYMDTCHSGA